MEYKEKIELLSVEVPPMDETCKMVFLYPKVQFAKQAFDARCELRCTRWALLGGYWAEGNTHLIWDETSFPASLRVLLRMSGNMDDEDIRDKLRALVIQSIRTHGLLAETQKLWKGPGNLTWEAMDPSHGIGALRLALEISPGKAVAQVWYQNAIQKKLCVSQNSPVASPEGAVRSLQKYIKKYLSYSSGNSQDRGM
jgi:hypothetical protein